MKSCRHGQSKLCSEVHSGKHWCSESTRTQERSGPCALFYNYLSNEESVWRKWARPTNVLLFAVKLQSCEEPLTDHEWKPLISKYLESGDLFPIFMHAYNFFLYNKEDCCISFFEGHVCYGTHIEVKGQLVGVGSFLLLLPGTWGRNSWYQAYPPSHPVIQCFLWKLSLECVTVGMVCIHGQWNVSKTSGLTSSWGRGNNSLVAGINRSLYLWV